MKKTPDYLKRLYNDHLAISRTFKRKPFKLRKNFDKFPDDDRYKYYARLANWFNKHPEINQQMYFEATLFFNKDVDYIHIKEYCKSLALTNYTQYLKILKTLNLDNPKSIEMCGESFKFIKKYCTEHNIDISDYLKANDEVSKIPIFLKHVKNLNVSLYVLFAFDELNQILKTLYRDIETWNFYLEEFNPTFLYDRYNNSTTFKSISEKILAELKKTTCKT